MSKISSGMVYSYSEETYIVLNKVNSYYCDIDADLWIVLVMDDPIFSTECYIISEYEINTFLKKLEGKVNPRSIKLIETTYKSSILDLISYHFLPDYK